MNVFYLVTVISIFIFLISYFSDRRRIINGFLFTFSLLMFFASLGLISNETNNIILRIIFIGGLLVFVLVSVLGIVVMIVVLFTSAYRLLTREGLHFHNALSLLFALSLVVVILVQYFDIFDFLPIDFSLFFQYVYLIYGYFCFVFFHYLVATILYSLQKPKYNYDVIIVLGSGLLNGKDVSPLLKRRIDKAISISKKQVSLKRKEPYILLSGGRGNDELVSEAHAMKEYASKQDVSIDKIIIENQSANTYENMRFSKTKIEKLLFDDYNVIFTTSSYHVFRASIYAKKAHLNAQGFASKDPFYFWANAMIREFVAIITMYKVVHVIFMILILITFATFIIVG